MKSEGRRVKSENGTMSTELAEEETGSTALLGRWSRFSIESQRFAALNAGLGSFAPSERKPGDIPETRVGLLRSERHGSLPMPLAFLKIHIFPNATLSQASQSQFAHDGFFLGGAAVEESFEGGDEGGLEINQALERKFLGGFAEFAEVPDVLGEDVERGLFLEATEMFGVGGAGGLEGVLIEAAVAEAEFAAVKEDAELDHQAVAALQAGKERAGGMAGKEIALQGVEGPGKVAGEEGFGGLEEIAFAEIGDEVADEFLGNGAAGGAQIGGDLAGLLEGETGVAVDFAGEHLEGAGGEGDTTFFGLLFGEVEDDFAGIFAAEELIIPIFLQPLELGAAAVHGAGGNEDGDGGGVHGLKEGLQILDQFFGALGAAGHGVGEEVGVFEPDDFAIAEEGDGLDGGAEVFERDVEFVKVLDAALDDFAGEVVGEADGQLGKQLTPALGDEEIVVTADEGEGFDCGCGGHGGIKN